MNPQTSTSTLRSPELAVLIPSHSRTDLLCNCLRSLESAGAFATTRMEVVVIDDGSPHAAVSKIAQAWPRVRILRNQRSLGFCGAVNAGLQAVNVPVIQLLNDDAEVTPDWSTAPLARFAQNPRIAAVSPLILRRHDDRIDSAGDEYFPAGFARKRGHGQVVNPRFQVAQRISSANGCGAFFRRTALLDVGGFPTDFGAYFDDVDVSCRLRRAGWEIWFEPASLLRHHGSASYGRRPSPAALAIQSRNEEWLFWRNHRGVFDVAGHVAVLAGKACRRLEDGQLRPFLEGRLRAWAGLVAAKWTA